VSDRPPVTTRAVEPEALITAGSSGDRRALARLLSVVERGGDGARAISRLTYPRGGVAVTVGLTGPPGAGKSTVTSALIGALRARGSARVGVLAIDPSSPFSGGAILGDRVRMQDHALDPGVFIRSMATRGHLGGLAVAVPEAIRVLDACGWTDILVETVGVGQVEVDVAGACDTTVVLVNPGWGDAVQANKAGLLEVADIFVINKADRPGLREARRDLEQMLQLSQGLSWRPPILATTATTGEGVGDLLEAIDAHRCYLEESGTLKARRTARLKKEISRIVTSEVDLAMTAVLSDPSREAILSDLLDRYLDPYEGAASLLDAVIARLRTDPPSRAEF
jgi:LAO/AO transport system kinase